MRDERDRARFRRTSRIWYALDVRRAHEGIHDDRIELDPGELAQFSQRLLVRERRHPIRAGRRHRLEGVRDMEDPSELGDLIADESIRVARAVVPLVVMADDRQLRGKLGDRRDDLRAQDRMRVHEHPLLTVQAVRLQQDMVRHADLADVVQQATPFERFELSVVDPHHPADIDRDLLDPLAMPRGVRVALVDRLRKRPDGLREHVAHLDEPLRRHARRVQRQREQQRRPPLDRIHDGHEPPKGTEGEDRGRSPSGFPNDYRAKRSARAQRQE